MPLTAFERGIVEFILEGTHPNVDIVRAQLSDCMVTAREVVETGFSAYLTRVQQHPPLVKEGSVANGGFSGPDVDIPDLLHGAGTVIFFKEGWLDAIECFGYDEWHGIPSVYRMHHPSILHKEVARYRGKWINELIHENVCSGMETTLGFKIGLGGHTYSTIGDAKMARDNEMWWNRCWNRIRLPDRR